MSKRLSNHEIKERLVRLRNVEQLYEAQKEQLHKERTARRHLREENTRLKEEVKDLKEQVSDLSLRIDELSRIVFGKHKKNTGDRGNEEHGALKTAPPSPRTKESYQRAIPDELNVTKTEHHPLATCPVCTTPLTKKRVKVYYIEDVALPQKEVAKHTVDVGYCARCKTWHAGTPLPSARVILGETLRITVAYCSTILRLSYRQIQEDLRNRFGIQVSRGELIKLQYKTADRHRMDAERIKAYLRAEPVVHMDETGDRVRDGDGSSQTTWGMTGVRTPEVAYLMGRSRSRGTAEELLGTSTALGITDNCPVYATLFANHQLCWAHLHRKLRDLTQAPSLPQNVLTACNAAFTAESHIYAKIRTLANRHDLTDRQRTWWYTHLSKRLGALSRIHPDEPRKLRTYKKTLARTIAAYLTCIRLPDVPCDNNRAERILRHPVIKRKTSFGHISAKGADMMSILMTVFMTMRNRIQGTSQTFFEAYAGGVGV